MGCNESKPDLELQGAKALLNETFDLNGMKLQNRFVMGPMTRSRTDADTAIPNDLMAEYYEQRASFGLILTECSQVSSLSNAFPGSGGMYNEEQMKGWKKVVDRVHAKGAKIIIQLWHCGRAVAKDYIGGQEPIAPSDIPINFDHYVTKKPHPTPKEMTQADIDEVKQQFKRSAELAKEAGFDGIQLHGANGYLIDQFLRDDTNKRKDKYGGCVKGRSTFLLELIEEVCKVYPSNRVSVRLSPTGRFNDMYDSNPDELMKYLLGELSKKDLQFVEIKRHGQIDNAEAENGSTKDKNGRTLPELQIPEFFKTLRSYYKGVLMANDGFTPKQAEEAIIAGECDIVSFAKLALANPDLPERHQNNQEFNTNYDFSTFFVGGAKGYTDYPVYSEQQKTKGEEKKE